VRLATVIEGGTARAVVVDGERVLVLDLAEPGFTSVREIAGAGAAGLTLVRRWAARQPASAWRRLADARLGPAVPEPGAVYTVGLNYRGDGVDPGADPDRPPRPLIYGKAASAVAAHGELLAWDRGVTDDVDAECELGVVIGAAARDVPVEAALDHVFGYTVIDDVSARDPWLDGDQWLIGKSMPGFCPVGPWVVTADELDVADLALGCRINGEPIQAGRTSAMRFSVAEIVAFLSRHLLLRPGDLVATGTPPRLATPPGPGRRLRVGDDVTCWIDGIGELTTRIA
jgi:2-keto-4-pentenoate hydratase/2-oxohepta-3-ene-1,7-dioic acid hydratase in catechol pathway